MNSDRPERRSTARISVEESARILGPGVGEWEGTLVDISQGGACIVSYCQLQVGEQCVVAFDVPAGGMTCRVNVWCVVAHTTDNAGQSFRIGVMFTDMDSYSRMLIQGLPNLDL